MYAGRPWTIRQYAGFSTAEESNAFYRRNLAAGQKGLSVAFDLATHRGYDSDNPRVAGDVGMAGVAIDSVEDMKLLFDGIPLGEMSVSMTMNGAVLPVMAFFIVAGEEQGVPRDAAHRHDPERHSERVRGPQHLHLPARTARCGSSPTSSLIARRRCRSSTRSRSAAITCTRPGRRRCRSSPTRSPTAWNMSACAKADGLDIDDFAPRLSFFFGIGMNLFMEVAKLRAARTLWDADHDRSRRARRRSRSCCAPTARRAGVSLTEQDPYNNIVRTTIEALAAVLGGTQSLHTNSFDEAIALPTDFSARIARNTQLILAEESGVTAVADPLGGSWYVETLTRELEEKAWALIEEVEAHGGMTKAVAEGLPKHRIEEAAAARAAKVDTGETVIVGVNRYRLAEEEEHDILEVDNAKVRAGQIARIEKVRAARDEAKVRAALDALTKRQSSPAREPVEARMPPHRFDTLGASEFARAAVEAPAPAARSAKFPTRWSARSGATAPARAGARNLRQGAPRRALESGGRGHALGRRPPRPQAADHGRQDGPGRPRPRRQPGVVGLHRSGLRSDPRPAVPDPARDRANGGRAMTSTWSAQARSPRATAP